VRAGVVQVLALEQDLCATDLTAEAFGVVDRTRPAHVVGEVLVVGGDKGRIAARLVIGGGQLLQRPDQGFGDEAAAVTAEMPLGIRIGMEIGDGGCGGGGHGATTGGDRLTL